MQLQEFRDGVYFVSLEELQSSDSIPMAIAENIQFHFHSDSDPIPQLFNYLHRKQLLFVIDAFEHLLDEAGFILQVLKNAPGIKILVTSRERLGLLGETSYLLKGLTLPEQGMDDIDQEIFESSAVQLFIQSALLVRSDFAPKAEELPELIQICHLVQGMPLGLILAATWVDLLTLGEIADELNRGLSLLESELVDLPERQRSIRAVFDHSWHLLSEAERSIFMKLSVFHSGFTRDSSREIAGAELDDLAHLVRRSLVQHDAEKKRYHIHPLLRQYISERLIASGHSELTNDTHMRFYCDFLGEQEVEIKGHRQLKALDRIEMDFENIRAAWRWAVKRRDYVAINHSIEGLYWFCHLRGRVQEGEELLSEARARLILDPGDPGQRRLQIRFDASGDEYRQQLEHSLEFARDNGDLSDVAFLLWALGVNGYVDHDFSRAIAILEESLTTYRELNDPFYIVETLHLLGVCSRFLGKNSDAMKYEQEAIDLSRTGNNQLALARAISSRGMWLLLSGEFDTAGIDLEEGLSLRREIGDRAGVAMCHLGLGWISFFEGNLANARDMANKALGIGTEVNHPNSMTTALYVLGWIAAIEEDYKTARIMCEESLSLAPDPTVSSGAELALCYAACGLEDYSTATAHLKNPLEHFSALGGAVFVIGCLPVEAILRARENEGARAVELLSFIFAHPLTEKSWIESWPLLARLRAELEGSLGEDAYADAWKRGSELELDEVIAELLIAYQV
jgi:predicted ATPase